MEEELRIHNGLTQEQLAEKLSVTRQSVSKWEMEQSLPEIDKVVLMSKLFSVGTNEILFLAIAIFIIIKTASPRYAKMQKAMDGLNNNVGETLLEMNERYADLYHEIAELV